MTARQLRDKSIEVILANQNESGAFVASPNFPPYRYSWLRDGSFIAYALVLHERREPSLRFLQWAHRTIVRHAGACDRLEEKLARGAGLVAGDFLPTRFTLDGRASNDDWPNFQIDGYGTWLWCVAQYVQATGDTPLLDTFAASIEIVCRYLTLAWRVPCYDCWEEHGSEIHPATLACVYGGLTAINAHLRSAAVAETAEAVRRFVLALPGPDNAFPKSVGSAHVDASLIWLAVPFGLAAVADQRMLKTVAAIESDLVERGGVKRYRNDTYYGGGQWILLTAWLGWYYARSGKPDRAQRCLKWVLAQCDVDGSLPEQALDLTNDPSFIAQWVAKWGEVANPLLWSHAMFLVLYAVLGASPGERA
jgi:GH15 family glucan-1,4-alpha-glucosidase